MTTVGRILVADDHEEIRHKIVQLLEQQFDVLGAMADGSSFLKAVDRSKPDLCVLDICMPDMSGIDVAQQIKQRHSQIKIVFVTLHDDLDFRAAARATGAEGYVTKAKMGGELLFAVRGVLAGGRFFRMG